MKALTSEVRKVKAQLLSACADGDHSSHFIWSFSLADGREASDSGLMGTQMQSVKSSHARIASSCKDLSPCSESMDEHGSRTSRWISEIAICFVNEFALLDSLESIKVNNIKPQKTLFVFPVVHGVIVLRYTQGARCGSARYCAPSAAHRFFSQ